MMLPLTATALRLHGRTVTPQPLGDVATLVRAHRDRAGEGPHGLVLVGTFGSGKTSLCAEIAAETSGARPCTLVPLAVLGRAPSVAEGLERVVGRSRLEEAAEGRRMLLLDGLDEVPSPPGGYDALYRSLRALVGPRWVLTSRPGFVRLSPEADDDVADTLADEDVLTATIDPLPAETVEGVLSALPGGRGLLRTVEGLADLASSPLLLHIVHAALPHIEPGRPIEAWGLFDAWLRYALDTGPGHAGALHALEALAWQAFEDSGFSTETMSFHPDALAAARLPPSLRRALLVTELDGRVRFGHRSVFEYLLATHIAPRLGANQGHGPDALSGLRITEATRAFLVGRVPRLRVRCEGDRVWIPRGNYVAGGMLAPDERPLRIQHVAEPYWISRVPVTHDDWAAWLAARPDDRQDAWYLRHWGPERQMPEGGGPWPIFHVWPEDADAYAAWKGARLPTADEWEKAVRGIDGRRWPWGDHARAALAITSDLGVERPLPVRAFGAQGPGNLFSAVGGVFETTASAWRDRPDRGRVVMGGAFTHELSHARPSLRLSHTLSGNLKAGLRLAWDG